MAEEHIYVYKGQIIMKTTARDKLQDLVVRQREQEKASREWELSKYTTDELKLELENRLLEQNLYARKDTIDYEMEDGKEIVFDTEDPKCRRFL